MRHGGVGKYSHTLNRETEHADVATTVESSVWDVPGQNLNRET